jgi:hypothetical protein
MVDVLLQETNGVQAPGRRCALPWAVSSSPVGAMEDQHVLNTVGRILELQEFAFARNFSVTYQARLLIALKPTQRLNQADDFARIVAKSVFCKAVYSAIASGFRRNNRPIPSVIHNPTVTQSPQLHSC